MPQVAVVHVRPSVRALARNLAGCVGYLASHRTNTERKYKGEGTYIEYWFERLKPKFFCSYIYYGRTFH